MKTLINFLVLINLTFSLNAQTFQKVYNWTYNSEGYSLVTVSDGYLLLGSTRTANNQLDILLIKTDLQGDTLWTKTYGGTGNDVGYAIKKTSDNGFIVAGYTMSQGAGQSDVYLIKLNSVGAEQWTQTFGGVNADIGYAVEQTVDDGFIISGYTESFGEGLEDVYLIRTDSLGVLVWENPYGSSCRELSYAVKETSTGDFILTGITTGEGGTAWMVHVVKVSSNGSLVWSKSYDFSLHPNNKLRYGYSIIENDIQEYVLTGSVGMGGIGDAQAFILKLSQSGTINSSTVYTWNSGDCYGYSLLQTGDGGYIVGGTMAFGFPTLMKLNSMGTGEWAMSYLNGGASYGGNGYSANITTDGGYAILGYHVSASADTSMYLIKTDSVGNSGSPDDFQPTDFGSLWTHTTSVNAPDPFCTSNSLEEQYRELNYKIYPNPVTSSAVLEFTNPDKKEYSLIIFDSRLRLIERIAHITNDHVIISKGGLQSGMYFYQLMQQGELMNSGKFIIE